MRHGMVQAAEAVDAVASQPASTDLDQSRRGPDQGLHLRSQVEERLHGVPQSLSIVVLCIALDPVLVHRLRSRADFGHHIEMGDQHGKTCLSQVLTWEWKVTKN
ncbi:hypothetical protein FPOAC2_04063 [Fusarium poae]|jgi:hypothetical protein